MTSTNFVKKATAVAVAALGALTFAASPAAAAGGRSYDTNRDGRPDVTVRGIDTDGNRTEDGVHIDTDRDGVVDPGEIVCKCPNGAKATFKATPGNNGVRIEIFCGKPPQPFKAFVVQDQNGDGDTADAGEVRPG